MSNNTLNRMEQGGDVFNIGGTLAFPSGEGGVLTFGALSATEGTDHLSKTIEQALAAATVQAIQNNTGVDLLVERLTLTWTGTLANITLDCGTAATATASSDNLMDGVVLAGSGTTKYAASNLSDAGTNGKAQQVWASGKYLTITNNGTFTGLDGVIARIKVTDL